jgi:hypothetical protein
MSGKKREEKRMREVRGATLLVAVMVLVPGLMLAQPAEYPDSPRSIAGSYAEPDGDIATSAIDPATYIPGEQTEICFYVSNGSDDAEWMRDIQFTFPADFSIVSMSDAAGPSDSGDHAWVTSGTGTNVAHWSEGDCTGYGEMWGGSDHYFCAVVDVPDTVSGTQTITYNMEGDGWGSEPHKVCSPGDACAEFCPDGTGVETAASDLTIEEGIVQERRVPTLSTVGIGLMVLVLAGAAILVIRRRF